MASQKEIYSIIDFILNRADGRDLEAIRIALDKRVSQKSSPMGNPEHIGDLDFKKMARAAVENLSGKYASSPDEIHNMTRRLVEGMIREKMPGIPDGDLQALLNQWVPDARTASASGRSHQGREFQLPDEAVLAMIDQFVRYSLNVMPKEEIAELVRSAENWYEKYWEIFSLETKNSIKDLLDRKMDLDQFWHRTKNRIRARNK